jgi:hypothetical protein
VVEITGDPNVNIEMNMPLDGKKSTVCEDVSSIANCGLAFKKESTYYCVACKPGYKALYKQTGATYII